MLVMFYADWAGPCNLARPEFEAVAKRRGNEVIFAQFNVDDNTDIPSRYNVRSLPNFILFVDGKPVRMVAGAVGAAIIEGMLDE